MIFGETPFYCKNNNEMYERIIDEPIIYPNNINISN
jgi:hypothetical protein